MHAVPRGCWEKQALTVPLPGRPLEAHAWPLLEEEGPSKGPMIEGWQGGRGDKEGGSWEGQEGEESGRSEGKCWLCISLSG
jgi:hypothetical protein